MLEPDTVWRLKSERETWLLVIGGGGVAATFDIATGDAIFAEDDNVEIHTGEIGMVALVAYVGPNSIVNLLTRSETVSVQLSGALLREFPSPNNFLGSGGTPISSLGNMK